MNETHRERKWKNSIKDSQGKIEYIETKQSVCENVTENRYQPLSFGKIKNDLKQFHSTSNYIIFVAGVDAS